MRKKVLLMMLLMALFAPLAMHAQQAIPYTYGFEDNDLSIDGWTAVVTSTNSRIYNMSSYAHTGDYLFGFIYSEDPGYLVSPLLTGTDDGVDVSFYYYEPSNEYGDEHFQVGYTTDETVTDPSAFTYYDEINTASMEWVEYIKTLPAGTKRVAVKYIFSDALYLFLDDFSFTAPAACQKPTGLTVDYSGGTTAEVSWTSEARSFNIDVNGTVTENVTNPYTLTDLEFGTVYEVKVQANCENNQTSDWFGPATFKTDYCMPEDQCQISYVLVAKPYQNSYQYGWYYSGIYVIDVTTNVVIDFLTVSLGESTAIGTFTVCDGREIAFEWYQAVNAGNDNLLVDSYSVINANGETIISGEGPMTSSVTYTVDCTVTNCLRPTDLAVSEIGPHSAKLNWTENGEATEWIVAYKMGDDEFTEEEVYAKPYNLSGLRANSPYTVKVRPMCSDFDNKWSDEITFTTDVPCPNPTSLVVNPSPSSAEVSWNGWADTYNLEYAEIPNSAKSPYSNDGWYYYDNGINADAIGLNGAAFSWGVMFPAGYFYGDILNKVSIYDYANMSGTLSIYNDGVTAPANQIYTQDVTLTGTGAFVEFNISDLSIDPTKNVWVVFGFESGDNQVAATCLDENGDANGRWVEVYGSWYDLANAGVAGQAFMIRAHFEFSFDPSSLDWHTVTGITSPYTINNLDPETKYAVRVKALCGGNDGESDWVMTTFTTLSNCEIPSGLTANAQHTQATLSWTGYQNRYEIRYRTAETRVKYYFNDFNDENAEGWTRGYFITGFADPIYNVDASSNHFLEMGWDSTEEETIISCELPTYENGAYVEFYYFGYQTANTFQVGYSTTTTDADAFTWSDAIEAPLSTYTLYQKELDAGVKYVAFKATASTRGASVFIDDFGIFGETISAGIWQTINRVTTNPYTLVGLTADTEYEWEVRGINANCTGGKTDWSETASFTTLDENTKIFTTEGNWNEANNWSPVGAPTIEQDAIITVPATITDVAYANDVTIEEGGSITIEDGGQLYHNTDDLVVTMKKNITAYTDANGTDNYHLLAFPFNEYVEVPTTMTAAEGNDFYMFDNNEVEEEWQNNQTVAIEEVAAFNGYLYANPAAIELSLTGSTYPTIENINYVILPYDNGNTVNGWYLLGNPFIVDAYIYTYGEEGIVPMDVMYYDENGDLQTISGGPVAPMQGFFVNITKNSYVYFLTFEYSTEAKDMPSLKSLKKNGNTITIPAKKVSDIEVEVLFKAMPDNTKFVKKTPILTIPEKQFPIRK